MSPKRIPTPGAETLAALLGTIFSALLLVVTTMNAGPLWRDETNTFNLARMPSFGDVWHNLQFDSCPLLWPLLVRGFGILGLADSDLSIRILGLTIGFFFLASLWLCQHWIGGRSPTLSVALLGALPSFVFLVGANRAYGLAGCLLVLSFGKIWQVVERPTKSRIIPAGIICLLFVHCIYYDIIFLAALLAGGALVAIRRQQWKTVGVIVGIGVAAGASLFIYLPIIRLSSEYVSFWRSPFFNAATLWDGLREALVTPSGSHGGSANGLQIWIWIGLVLAAIVVAIALQRPAIRRSLKLEVVLETSHKERSDRALFCVTGVILGVIMYLAFLLKLQVFMQPWYYLQILILCAISIDGVLTVNWAALRPWGLLRIVLLIEMMLLNARPAWAEAQTRRSNLDAAASFISQNASPDDLIVIQDAWEGITFNRYYHGQTQWLSVPPINSHELHRVDLVMAEMNRPEAMTAALDKIINTLASGHHVWLVGSMPIARSPDAPPAGPAPLPPRPSEMPTGWWVGSYFYWWNQQVIALLLDHAQQGKAETIATPGPVNRFEDVSVVRFTGYNPGLE